MNFVDAQEMHKLHPDTFEVPNEYDLSKIKENDFVKVCHNGERFWTKVKKIKENKDSTFNDEVWAVIDNDLVCGQPFKCGDTIKFEKRHIFTTME